MVQCMLARFVVIPERIALKRISKANMTALDVKNVMVTMLHWTEV